MSELGPEARAVVEAGRAGDDPTERDRARVRAALMTAISAGSAGAASVVGEGTVAAGAAKGAATVGAVGAATLGWGWKALLVGLAAVGTLGVGVAVSRSQAEAPDHASPAQGSAPPATSTPTRPAEPATSTSIGAPRPPVPGGSSAPAAKVADGAPAAPLGAPASPSAGVAHAPAPAVSAAPHGSALARPAGVTPAPSPRPVDDPLVAETRALGEAHGAIQNGDPARALSLLDEQSAAYADGQLRQERAAARVLALCKLGRNDEGRALAARFLADYPSSPLADRVRGACPAGDPR